MNITLGVIGIAFFFHFGMEWYWFMILILGIVWDSLFNYNQDKNQQKLTDNAYYLRVELKELKEKLFDPKEDK